MVDALLTLYTSAGGANWTHSDRWLQGEPCVDSWYGVSCCPDAYPLLRADNALGAGGHACASVDGEVTRVHNASLCVYGGAFGVCHVVGLSLSNNSLTGTLGEGLSETLSHLQRLELASNGLTGPLPASLALLGGTASPMQRLALSDNAFDYEASNENQLLRLVQRCKEGATFLCVGLPPVSCSAFGPRHMVQAKRPDTCERCGELWVSAVLMSTGATVTVLGLSLYIWLIGRMRSPNALRKWVSTSGIILNHLQTVSIVILLKLHWPPSVEVATSFFSVDFFEWASTRPECLVAGLSDDVEEYGGVALLYTALRVTLLLVLLQSISAIQFALKQLGRLRGWSAEAVESRVDKLEMFETVVFSVQLTAALRLCAQLIDAMFTGSALQLAAGVVGWLLLATECAFVIKYLHAAHSLALVMHAELEARRSSLDGSCPAHMPQITAAGVHGGARSAFSREFGSGRHSVEARDVLGNVHSRPACGSAAACASANGRRSSVGAAADGSNGPVTWRLVSTGDSAHRRDSAVGRRARWPCLRALQAVCTCFLGRVRFGSKHKSRQRLNRRLNFLMKRFDNHAWFWQFVVWARQVLLTLVVVLPELLWKLALRSGAVSAAADATDASTSDGGAAPVATDATPTAGGSSVQGLPLGFSLLQSGLAFLIFLIFFLFHCRRMPYPYHFQNMLDACLFLADLLTIGLATLYTLMLRYLSSRPELHALVEGALLVTIIGSVVGTAAYLAYRSMRQKRRAKAAADTRWLEDDDFTGSTAHDLDLAWWDATKPVASSDEYGARTHRTRRSSNVATWSWSRAAHNVAASFRHTRHARHGHAAHPDSTAPCARSRARTVATPPTLTAAAAGGDAAAAVRSPMRPEPIAAVPPMRTAPPPTRANGAADSTSATRRVSRLRGQRTARLQEFLAGCEDPHLEGEFSPSRRLPVDEPPSWYPPPRAGGCAGRQGQRRSVPVTGTELIAYHSGPEAACTGQPAARSGRRMSAFI